MTINNNTNHYMQTIYAGCNKTCTLFRNKPKLWTVTNNFGFHL